MARYDPDWAHVIEMEIEACREPGCLDMGTHVIAVCRKDKEPGRPKKSALRSGDAHTAARGADPSRRSCQPTASTPRYRR
jgi:hypothetical protein